MRKDSERNRCRIVSSGNSDLELLLRYGMSSPDSVYGYTNCTQIQYADKPQCLCGTTQSRTTGTTGRSHCIITQRGFQWRFGFHNSALVLYKLKLNVHVNVLSVLD